MINITELEECYKNYINNLNQLIPDAIVNIDLNTLQQLDILTYDHPGQYNPGLTSYFQLVESPEKITLVNDNFTVWISPRKSRDIVSTCTIIAINRDNHPHLEMAFVASGVYNTSPLVLRILEKFLSEIQENEDLLHRLDKN